jgi:hypothetical protein
MRTPVGILVVGVALGLLFAVPAGSALGINGPQRSKADAQALKAASPLITHPAAVAAAKNAAPSVAAPLGPVAGTAVLAGLTPTVGRSWQGVADNTGTPSDSTGAVGPTRYFEIINSKFAVYDRTHDAPLGRGTLSDLTPGAVSNDVLGDVQALWDPATSRFYYLVDDFQNDVFYMGFSTTDSPSSASDFCKYTVDFGYGSDLPDYPKLGDTQNFLLVGVNVFAGGISYSGAEVNWIKKPAPGTTCPSPASFTSVKGSLFDLKDSGAGNPRSNTPVPAVQTDPGTTGWVVASDVNDFDKISLFKVQEDAGATSVTVQQDATGISVPSFSLPPTIPQKGSSSVLDSLDARLTQAVSGADPSQGGTAVWTQHTVAGGAGSEVRWYEIDPNGAGIDQQGAASDSSLYAFNGAIAPDRLVNGSTTAFGDSMVLGFNTSSATSYPSIRMISKIGAAASSPFVLVKAGTGPENDYSCSPCRWGDFSGASADPGADAGAAHGQVWATNMWSHAGSDSSDIDWGTWNWSALAAITPGVSNFSPASGAVGSRVVIVGAGFTGTTEVDFLGVPARFRVHSDSQITATVPAAATSGTIAVTAPGGPYTSSNPFGVTPTLKTFSPMGGLVGTIVDIKGTGFAGASDVTFGGVDAGAPTIVSPTEITVAVPGGAVAGPIQVAVGGGGTVTSGLVCAVVFVTDFNPHSGPAGATVTITGSFARVKQVLFGNGKAHFDVLSPTSISAVVPARATIGTVEVVTAYGTATSAATFTIAPTIVGFSPSKGVVGATVTINGSGLDGATAVSFNGTSAAITLDSPTKIKVTVPPGVTMGPISVTTPGGTASTTGPFTPL